MVGSFISMEDAVNILSVDKNSLPFNQFVTINNRYYIDELKLMKLWYNNRISGNQYIKKSSFDELILCAIIKKTYTDAEIVIGEKVGRYLMDIKIVVNNTTKYIEFDGPLHFCITRFGPPKKHPFDKKKIIEDRTGVEVINWPYWIQRCETNVRAIFNHNIKGYGALWSANAHFGDFIFEDSADIIKTMSERFGAWREDGACSFYEENSLDRVKPEHPILNRIFSGHENVNRIIPKGYTDINKWIPEKIRV